MPPTPPNQPHDESTPHVSAMPQQQKGGTGATVGIIIIVVLMLFGGLYFWGAHLNGQNAPQQLPLIPAESSSQ